MKWITPVAASRLPSVLARLWSGRGHSAAACPSLRYGFPALLRLWVAPHNSLHSLRSFRSDRRGEYVYEACGVRTPTQSLRCSAAPMRCARGPTKALPDDGCSCLATRETPASHAHAGRGAGHPAQTLAHQVPAHPAPTHAGRHQDRHRARQHPARQGRQRLPFQSQALAKVFRAKVLDATRHAGLTLPAALPDTWVVDCRCVGDG